MILAITGTGSAWNEAARWWAFMAILANIAFIYLLMRVFNAEWKQYFEAIHFSRATLKTDLIWFFIIDISAALAHLTI